MLHHLCVLLAQIYLHLRKRTVGKEKYTIGEIPCHPFHIYYILQTTVVTFHGRSISIRNSFYSHLLSPIHIMSRCILFSYTTIAILQNSIIIIKRSITTYRPSLHYHNRIYHVYIVQPSARSAPIVNHIPHAQIICVIRWAWLLYHS